MWKVVCRTSPTSASAQPHLSPADLALYMRAIQKRLDRVAEALGRWQRQAAGKPTVSEQRLLRLEQQLIDALAQITTQWERRN
jgi:hypothetical protein